MVKDKLIELLNKTLQSEYYDIFLYPRQAGAIKEKEISETFEKFGRMEVRHADNIAMQILILGGKPKWEFEPLDTKESLEEMLYEHLKKEGQCIHLYDKLIESADKEGEDQLKLILKGIKSEEESHLAAIKELIERKKSKLIS